jgi:hypothetical protein
MPMPLFAAVEEAPGDEALLNEVTGAMAAMEVE